MSILGSVRDMENTQKVSDPPACWYCRGARALCTCAEDCGARPDESLTGNSHVCGKAPAEVIAGWLRSTGLYSEDEIAQSTGTSGQP